MRGLVAAITILLAGCDGPIVIGEPARVDAGEVFECRTFDFAQVAMSDPSSIAFAVDDRLNVITHRTVDPMRGPIPGRWYRVESGGVATDLNLPFETEYDPLAATVSNELLSVSVHDVSIDRGRIQRGLADGSALPGQFAFLDRFTATQIDGQVPLFYAIGHDDDEYVILRNDQSNVWRVEQRLGTGVLRARGAVLYVAATHVIFAPPTTESCAGSSCWFELIGNTIFERSLTANELISDLALLDDGTRIMAFQDGRIERRGDSVFEVIRPVGRLYEGSSLPCGHPVPHEVSVLASAGDGFFAANCEFVVEWRPQTGLCPPVRIPSRMRPTDLRDAAATDSGRLLLVGGGEPILVTAN